MTLSFQGYLQIVAESSEEHLYTVTSQERVGDVSGSGSIQSKTMNAFKAWD